MLHGATRGSNELNRVDESSRNRRRGWLGLGPGHVIRAAHQSLQPLDDVLFYYTPLNEASKTAT